MREKAEKAGMVLLSCQGPLIKQPDFFQYKIQSLGIDQAREIRQKAYLTPVLAQAKVFFIITNSFTPDAENFLLKLFEEPPLKTHFFIITSCLDNLSLILRSRLTILIDKKRQELSKEKKDFLAKFLKSSPAQRLEIVRKITDDRPRTSEFLKGLELAAVYFFDKDQLEGISEDVKTSRSLIDNPSLSCRLILEHLSLVLPCLPK